MAKKRIGILTSGGDCPGLNATIRGVAKACFETMGTDNVQIVGIQNGYYGLINNIARKMDPSEFSGILTQGGTILGTKRQPFKMISSIGEDNIDKVKQMKDTYKKQKLDCLLTLGGNGTHKTANLLLRRALTLSDCPRPSITIFTAQMLPSAFIPQWISQPMLSTVSIQQQLPTAEYSWWR